MKYHWLIKIKKDTDLYMLLFFSILLQMGKAILWTWWINSG